MSGDVEVYLLLFASAIPKLRLPIERFNLAFPLLAYRDI